MKKFFVEPDCQVKNYVFDDVITASGWFAHEIRFITENESNTNDEFSTDF